MPIGIVTGSGTYALPSFEEADAREVDTPWGPVALTFGRFAGVDAVHCSRHGDGHVRLSNHVTHRANVWALKDAGASCVVGCTACGAVDPTVPLGSLIVFDDLHFLVNRLPGGEVCTFFDQPGDERRAHWIYNGSPFSAEVRAALVQGAGEAGVEARDGGCYGHVDGPRFNTPAEIRALAACGVTAVSQTGGPETVLCGELELPYALVGFATDYANDVKPGEPTPVSQLSELMSRSTGVFSSVLAAAVPRLATASPTVPGVVFRLHQG
jgi:purine nucleoside phosphorylase